MEWLGVWTVGEAEMQEERHSEKYLRRQDMQTIDGRTCLSIEARLYACSCLRSARRIVHIVVLLLCLVFQTSKIRLDH